MLASHRGWDIGAAAVARALANRRGAPIFLGRYSRLLVDLNRSEQHPEVFSQWTRSLPRNERLKLLERHYRPYRRAVESHLRSRVADDATTLLVSVHSFTPLWKGSRRRADVGLLYDPSRPREMRLCAAWKKSLALTAPDWQVRRNYPYRGTSDGFSVFLRQLLPANRFACVELEFNQALLRRVGPAAAANIVDNALEVALAAVASATPADLSAHRGAAADRRRRPRARRRAART